MAKHSSTGPFGSGEKPIIDIDDDRWKRIEHAYGSSLSLPIRARIIRAIESYLFLHSVERTPERMAKVKVVLESHDKAASRFFNELFTGPSVTSDAGAYAHYLIENNFKSSQTELGLDGLLDVLRAFHIACNVSIKQLNDPSSSKTRKSDAWSIWINRLAEIVSEGGSPIAVLATNSSMLTKLPSLVGELQSFLPRQCRHDDAGLVDDISEALAVGSVTTSPSL